MLILLVAVVILLAGGIVQLFSLRFRQGDIYPPYSSLRADPLGTKVLFEALEGLGNQSIERNLRPVDKLEISTESTLVFLGLNADQDTYQPSSLMENPSNLSRGGARFIVGFLPVTTQAQFNPMFPVGPAPVGGTRGALQKMQEQNKMRTWRELMETIDVRLEFSKPNVDRSSKSLVPFEAILEEEYANYGLPETLNVRTGLYFVPANSSPWKIVYQIEDRPVILERAYGKGSIVLMAEGYPLSNEAINAERKPALIGWLLGDATRVVFDETHLGIEQTPGLMNLARKYGLHAAFASLGLLAMLFIWYAMTPVVPRRSEEEEVEHIARGQNRDAFAGMVNLLRRSVRPQDLMEVCLAQWKRTLRGTRPGQLVRIQQADAAARIAKDAGRLRSAPAESYREIFEILNRRGGNP